MLGVLKCDSVILSKFQFLHCKMGKVNFWEGELSCLPQRVVYKNKMRDSW